MSKTKATGLVAQPAVVAQPAIPLTALAQAAEATQQAVLARQALPVTVVARPMSSHHPARWSRFRCRKMLQQNCQRCRRSSTA